MIEYFRNRVLGVIREMPSLSDPENANILVATMNGLTDEAWVSGRCLIKMKNKSITLANRTQVSSHCEIQMYT